MLSSFTRDLLPVIWLINEWARPLLLLQPAGACCQGSLLIGIKAGIQGPSRNLSATQSKLQGSMKRELYKNSAQALTTCTTVSPLLCMEEQIRD